jgi:hypothetical protein
MTPSNKAKTTDEQGRGLEKYEYMYCTVKEKAERNLLTLE